MELLFITKLAIYLFIGFLYVTAPLRDIDKFKRYMNDHTMNTIGPLPFTEETFNKILVFVLVLTVAIWPLMVLTHIWMFVTGKK